MIHREQPAMYFPGHEEDKQSPFVQQRCVNQSFYPALPVANLFLTSDMR